MREGKEDGSREIRGGGGGHTKKGIDDGERVKR